ncbi:hypothetical protein NP493_2407g00003 [Ridgeia piscesae]|uniref:Uncharacterized protein n=1 Tax=Ridgeia piscesae TaxID=27915 RepID=A0AAD9JGM1_RIDPI|nr:hypothetical protein NP493_2407g00003 [Ridgeia piscesae]
MAPATTSAVQRAYSAGVVVYRDIPSARDRDVQAHPHKPERATGSVSTARRGTDTAATVRRSTGGRVVTDRARLSKTVRFLTAPMA